MDTSTRAILAAGIAAGYVVGRTKKGKLALGIVALAVGRSLDPKDLISQGVSKVAENPELARLSEQIRGQLLGNGRSALSDVADRGLASLTGILQDQARSPLDGEADEEEEPDEDVYEDEDEETGQDTEEDQEVWDEDEEPEAREEEEEPARPARRRPAKKARAEKPTDRKPGPKNPPAKKAMARKAADRKAAAKKAASKRAEARDERRGGRGRR